MTDPFAALGLPATPMLTDAQVRDAWRAIAAATHPDRDDGGDPDAYRAASSAYAILRAPWGRTEAYADLPPARRQQPAGAAPALVVVPVAGPAVPRAVSPGIARLPARVRYGRPGRMAAWVLAAAVIAAAAWLSGAGTPAVAGVLALVVTWLVLTARGDLAPPPGR
jgi:hypothetical protein